MKLYCLRIAPEEYESESEDHDEWFSSLAAAKRRRAELIREYDPDPGLKYGEDYAIEEWTMRDDLPRKRLALAILNRRGWAAETHRVVVPPWRPPPRKEEEP